jgi:multiple sugar transport system ATP-binding protein
VFVAGFIGSPPMNLLKAVSTRGDVTAGDVALHLGGAPDGELIIGIRPEAFRIATGTVDESVVSVQVDVVELLGHETMVYGTIGGARAAAPVLHASISPLPSERTSMVARLDARRQPAPGETIPLAVTPAEVHLFDAESGAAIDRAVPQSHQPAGS